MSKLSNFLDNNIHEPLTNIEEFIDGIKTILKVLYKYEGNYEQAELDICEELDEIIKCIRKIRRDMK